MKYAAIIMPNIRTHNVTQLQCSVCNIIHGKRSRRYLA
jgi:hypothetical protein